MLKTTTLHSAVAWRLGSDSDVQSVLGQLDVAERSQPEPALHDAIRLISERRYEEALDPLVLARASPELALKAMLLRVYVLSLLGRREDAARVSADVRDRWGKDAAVARALEWLDTR
jgi:hypothetical protein